MTVREAMADAAMRAELDDLYEKEVLPVFAGIGMEDEARAYRDTVIDRFRNPVSRSPPRRNLHQSRSQEAAAFRRTDRAC